MKPPHADFDDGSTRERDILPENISPRKYQCRNECHWGFGSNSTERLPLLIQIHVHEELDVFHSDFLREFLQKNYVVCSCNISNSIDRRNLIEIWQEYFPQQPIIDLSTIEQCPMLIGAMTSFAMDHEKFFKYVPEVLVIDDVLVRTNEEFELELLFYELILFKEEFEKNVRYPSSRFVRNIVLCPELVLAISEYLSLNDAVATFPLDVLPLIWKYGKQLPVTAPSEEFLIKMSDSNNLDKITHLHLPVDQLIPHQTSENFAHEEILPFTQNHSLIVFSLKEPYFVNLTCLSLYYEGQMTFNKLCLIFTKIPQSIRHFRLKCESMECFDGSLKTIRVPEIPSNDTIETFVFHLRSSRNDYCEEYDKCPLNALIELIAMMRRIRIIHIFIKEHIERLLYAEKWIDLLERCRRLDAIKLRGKSNIESEMESREKIEDITDRLQQTRPSMNFQVQVKWTK